jgi:undecaprenyl-diphosphatase
MSILQAIILGVVQGLTELLPVSSSAHLYLVPWALGWLNSSEFEIAFQSFDVALHAGTLLAIVIFFFKDWLRLIKGGFNQVFKKEKSFEGKMFWYLVIATIPGGAIGFLLDHFLEDALKTPLIIGGALIIMGIILYVVDKKAKSQVEYENMTLKQTFLIGLSQALAFIPGVSRSGITMTTGRMLGIKRESVAKYSFLLSTPIVAGATLYKLKEFVISVPFFVGIAVSFIVRNICNKILIRILKKR